MKRSIQYKILISFSVIIFIGLSSLLFAANKITEENTLRIINGDMLQAKKNLDTYIKQYFLINNLQINVDSIFTEADNLSRELSSQIGSNVDIYDLEGKRVSNVSYSLYTDSDDLAKALKGQISYSINYSENKNFVSLSYPIKSGVNNIGIIRYVKDYTDLYNYSRRFKYIINFFAVIIFTVVFFASFIISKQIAKPIEALTSTSEQISMGNFNFNINIKSKDEIGELANMFKLMVQRIKEQIDIIEKDRDSLKESQKQNKIFFDNVTHELKTPLTTILGYSQVIKENGFTDRDFFDKGLSYIIDESRRLNDMVIELLELSTVSTRNAEYNFEKVNLSDLVRNTSEEMSLKSKKYNIDIHFSGKEALFVRGDYNKLKEVIINILDNSIKYGNVNSTINVEVYSWNDSICLKVKDRGNGITESHIDKLFEPFYRVSKQDSRERGSAGLGLSIVKNIIDKHGATVSINSIINEGTEVIIRFGRWSCE